METPDRDAPAAIPAVIAGEAGQPSPPTDGALTVAPAADAARGPRLFWWLTIALIVADQVTKALVRQAVPLYETMPVIDGVMDFVHVRNEGVAFGLLNNLDLQYKWLITTTLALLALAGITYYARHIQLHERSARLGLSMILGGAVGNLIDRVYAGYVLDFVDVYWGAWHFWAFNVADASISIGAVLVFIDLLLVKPHASHSV